MMGDKLVVMSFKVANKMVDSDPNWALHKINL